MAFASTSLTLYFPKQVQSAIFTTCFSKGDNGLALSRLVQEYLDLPLKTVSIQYKTATITAFKMPETEVSDLHRWIYDQTFQNSYRTQKVLFHDANLPAVLADRIPVLHVPAACNNALVHHLVDQLKVSFGNPLIVFDPEITRQVLDKRSVIARQSIGNEVFPVEEAFSNEEVEILGFGSQENLKKVQQRYPLFKRSTLSCYRWALLRANDPAVAALLSTTNGLSIEFLHQWGYEEVQELMEGDLVLYLKDGEPKHLGIYRGNGKVESKLGSTTPYYDLHAVTSVDYEMYGDQVLFYRKKQSAAASTAPSLTATAAAPKVK
jgi:hypothetical protein